MGYTNTTSHYSLPQYVATDKPKYLTDFNQTMEAIDTQMYTNAQAAATADGKAVSAKNTADGAVSSIGTLNTQINGDATDPSDRGLAGDVSDNAGAINTINSLIGNGTPTTTDQTIIGAINELHAEIGGGSTPSIPAADVTYDNTTSGLTADDVQAAIDEVYAAIPSGGAVEADDVVYDHTQSGLAATDVQAAIDELAAEVSDWQPVANMASLPANYKECYVLAEDSTGLGTFVHFLKASVPSAYRLSIANGNYVNSEYHRSLVVDVAANGTSISSITLNINGTAVSNPVVKVYVR